MVKLSHPPSRSSISKTILEMMIWNVRMSLCVYSMINWKLAIEILMEIDLIVSEVKALTVTQMEN